MGNPAENRWKPLISIIYAPKAAWKAILNRSPFSDYLFWLLLILSGTWATILVAVNQNSPYVNKSFFHFALYIFFVFFLELSIMLSCNVLLGALAKWVGNWLGGTGGYQKMYAVLLWVQLPFLYFWSLWTIGMLIGGHGKHHMALWITANHQHWVGYISLPWLSILVGFGLAEAHKVSAEKGLVISSLTYALPMLLLYNYIS